MIRNFSLRQRLHLLVELLYEKWRIENDPILRAKLEAKERAEKKKLLEEEDERKTQHRLWLEREAIAQERFRKKKEDEERKLIEKLEQEERIKREWEEEQKREKDKEEQKQKEINEKEDALFRELDKPSTSEANGPWHNPLAPRSGDSKSYGTEQDTVNCSFYLKTGACRFGESADEFRGYLFTGSAGQKYAKRCSRHHPRPSSSVTLMIPGMYNDIRLSQSMLDEADQDTSLEYDERDTFESFKRFYDDTLPEFRKAGTVVQFKVCCNFEPHLRGNVYVQFSSSHVNTLPSPSGSQQYAVCYEQSADKASLSAFVDGEGLFGRNRCPRGKNCNFLHVYHNPGDEFNHREDLSPTRTPFNGGRASERSDRSWRRDHWIRRRDLEPDRTRDRDWEQDRHRKRYDKDWSRERDDYRGRHRRRSRERGRSKQTDKEENGERRTRRRSYSDNEEREEETENKHLNERLSPSAGESNTEVGNQDGEKQHELTEKPADRKRKHHSSDKHSHRRKSKKKHKHKSERKKKKKRRYKSESETSSSESDNDQDEH
ncbi:U2 small nuclear ribonucleoprotein auxiliary factor 35 kDa subunit-related protein 1 [Stylophora pistillata]|uniref:U2 small nuclear ribonucleoprotein auxiliary factor 35 kDa subunit-related protein 1 n=1 Tax=Stylophora pistillata TaxID=50429 RepID=A0A2B4SYJ3_STYPI|nr:U2 small nuclear ribonucleoprotein auxiliary factor 35 kDa subunit-related protein 1 [Stylophora pistillata]